VIVSVFSFIILVKNFKGPPKNLQLKN